MLRGSSWWCCWLHPGHWLSSAHVNPPWAEGRQPRGSQRQTRALFVLSFTLLLSSRKSENETTGEATPQAEAGFAGATSHSPAPVPGGGGSPAQPSASVPESSRDESAGEERAKGPLPQLFTLLGLRHLLFHLSCHTCGMRAHPSASHQMFELTRSDSPGRPPQGWTAAAHPASSLINSPAADNILLSCGIFLLQGGVKPEPPKALTVFAQNKAANVSHSLGFLLGMRGLDTCRERRGPKGQEPSPGTR